MKPTAEKPKAITEASGTLVMGLEHRIKEEKSLEGKLCRSGDRYLDFSPEIPKAVNALILTLDSPTYELPLEYQTVSPEDLHTPRNRKKKGGGV